LEWKTIRRLLKKGLGNAIMLTRFDRVEPEAMEGLAGYLDLERETPATAADAVLERIKATWLRETKFVSEGCRLPPARRRS